MTKEINKIKIFGLIFGFLLVVGLLGAQIADAWEPPGTGCTPPNCNVDAPLHIGDQEQEKLGNLGLGAGALLYDGKLNVKGTICLNGNLPNTNCIDAWTDVGGPGGTNYWGLDLVDSAYIYPIINTIHYPDKLKIYSNIVPTAQRLYVVGDTATAMAAIRGVNDVNGTLYPAGRWAIIGRDDSTASVGNQVSGILGMAGGNTSDANAHLNHGVYGYAPDGDGVGVRGDGGYWGVVGSATTIAGVGVAGGGGSAGGSFAGNDYGVIGISDGGGTGVSANGYSDDFDLGIGVKAYGDLIGVESALNGHSSYTIGVLSEKIIRGGYLTNEIPEEDSYVGVKGQASELPVVGFNSISSHRTYGALGRNSGTYGGYIGAFGRGENFGVYGYSDGGTGIFACSGSNCSAKQPTTEKYGLYANLIGTNQDAIKGECDSCQSAIAGIHYGTGKGIYGQGPKGNSSSYAGYFDGQIFVDGVDWDDNLGPGGSDIGVFIGSNEKSGDSIKGTQNLWLWAQTGDPNDEPSVRVKDKLEVLGDLAVNGDHIKLTDGQDCSGLAAPLGGGAWSPMGTINYLRPPAPGTSAYKTLCVVTTGIQW